MTIKMKKSLSWILIMIISIGSISYADVDPAQPILGVLADEQVQVFKAGEKSTFTVNVKNMSSFGARELVLTLKGNHPFRSDIANLTKKVNNLNPKDVAKVTFDVTTSPTATSKIYEFDLQITYGNYGEGSYIVTEKVYARVENGNLEPVVGVNAYSTGQDSLKADIPDSLGLTLKNTGNSIARDIKVTISGFSNEGVVLHQETDTKFVKSLSANSTEFVYFNIIAGKDAVQKTYPINVVISYNDDVGNAFKKESTAYVTVEGKETANANLSISDVKFPSSVKVNENFTVSCVVQNLGDTELKTVDVVYEYAANFIAKTPAKVVVKNLAPKAKQTVKFTLMAKTDTVTESYHNYIKATFLPKGAAIENAQTVQEYVGIYVQGKDDSGTSKPKLIIENYEYGGEYVYAGQNYPLTISIKNTSKTESTKNIKVTLSSEENAFTPVASSASFFINSIGPGEVHTETIELKTKIDANVKIYTMTAKMQYEDGKGNSYDANKTPYEESETLSIAVAQPVRLETNELMIPTEIYVGQPFSIEQEFYNMGKSIMYNMMVKMEGPESAESSYFVGNFDAGRSDRFSASAMAYEVGTFNGKLIYKFEDALGTVTTVEKEFTYNVVEMPTFEEPTGDPMNPDASVDGEKKIELWKIIVGGLVALVVIGLIVKTILKRRRLKKEMEDLDE